ncbi:MAG: hypothetical protein AAFO69_08480 [Bacteroidota bacterium]
MNCVDWTYLQEHVYFCDGSWRDIYVQNASAEDWRIWVDFVNERYRIDWYNGKSDKDEEQIDFDIILQFWQGDPSLCSTARVFVEHIQINAHFFTSDEIENDIDPREFKCIEDHQKLMDYLTAISTLLQRPVVVTPEDFPEMILIEVIGEKIEIVNDLDPPKWIELVGNKP